MMEDGDGNTEAANKKNRTQSKQTIDEPVEEDSATAESRPKRTRAKRKQQPQETNEDADVVVGAEETPSESEAPAQKRRKKRQRAMVEPEGTSEQIDPTQVTMSTICDDPGSGRVSSRWETSQLQYAEARKRAREERERAIAEAAEEDRETGRGGARKGAPRPKLPEGGVAAESVVENTGADPDEFTYNETVKTSHYAPQVRIGANGEIVLDVESLQVDRAADPEIAEDAYSFVEESDQSKFTNSNSWSKRRSVRWGKEDTAMFYQALRQFGHNFDLIARVLPGRTYRMCKNKFKAEDKKNPGLIDDALKNGVAVDLDTLSRLTGKDFSGPTPIIEARKPLDLGTSDAPGKSVPDHAKTVSSVPSDDQTRKPETEQETQTIDTLFDTNPARRQSELPPPADPLLNVLDTTRASGSPPPAQLLLSIVGSAVPAAGPSAAVALSKPIRTVTPVVVSVPTRQQPVKQVTTSTSTQIQTTAGPPTVSPGKKGKNKAMREEGVEILGLVENHLDD